TASARSSAGRRRCSSRSWTSSVRGNGTTSSCRRLPDGSPQRRLRRWPLTSAAFSRASNDHNLRRISMASVNRRQFMGWLGTLAVAGGFPLPAIAQARPRVVVIGGGPGGATVAKYVAKDGGVDVMLIEPNRQFTTCFHSNLFLGGFRDWESLTHSYAKLANYGVAPVHQAAQAVDRDKRTVRLADGSSQSYDRLVMAPGIDLRFDSVPGYSESVSERLPHAWKPGPQTELLKRQLDAVPDGGVIVMIAPPNPYRCPPGPYERVSMMAHVLKVKGHNKS